MRRELAADPSSLSATPRQVHADKKDGLIGSGTFLPARSPRR